MRQTIKVRIDDVLRHSLEIFAWRQGPGEGAEAFGEFLVWWGGWRWVNVSECS